MTVLELLTILHAHGWRERIRVGFFRKLEHPDRPGVYINVTGLPSKVLDRPAVEAILAAAGIDWKAR